MATALLLLWTGCLLPTESSHAVPAGETASEVIGSNGLTINGLTINGLTINGLTINGIAVHGVSIDGVRLDDLRLDGAQLTSQQLSDVDKLMAYLIECALPASDSAILYTGGQPSSYAGLMGLAPEWKTGGLSLQGELKVSACIAARVNPQGHNISISIRHFEIETTAAEQDSYGTHEGAFWGNFFGSAPTVYACHVQGGGETARVCTESTECGFILMGHCATACAAYDAVNGYYRCSSGDDDDDDDDDDDSDSEVINAFLKSCS